MLRTDKRAYRVSSHIIVENIISNLTKILCKCSISLHDCGFISAKTDGPDFGMGIDVVC